MMSSDEEEETVVASGKKADVAEELKKSPAESDGSESDIISS